MMHVRFKEAWHGKVQQTILQIKWSSISNKLHIGLHLICRICLCILPCHASLNRTCIMLDCASCHAYVVVVFVFFFPVLLIRVSSDNVAFVRIRSTMSVCLLHGLIPIPCGILRKMTIPSKSVLSLLSSCAIYCYAATPTTSYIMPPILPCQASNPPFLANRFWLCYRFAQPLL